MTQPKTTTVSQTCHRVVCAAVSVWDHLNGPLVITGARHFDLLMHRQIARMNLNPALVREAEQGFIDNHGCFLDRKEALAVAKAAGQLIRKTQPEDELFSEDLY